MLLAVTAAALVAACSSDEQTADITKLSELKNFFGPQFHITEIPKAGINPKSMTGQKLPDGMKFDPADCAKYAATPQVPSDAKGNMTAVTAEGDGNRFITIALETNEPLPVVEPSDDCKKITFDGAGMKRDRNGLWIAMRKLYGECPDQHVERCLGGAITVPAAQPVVSD